VNRLVTGDSDGLVIAPAHLRRVERVVSLTQPWQSIMSAREKRTASTPQGNLDAIKGETLSRTPISPPNGLKLTRHLDFLVKAKSRLDDVRSDVRVALVDDLHQIAFLAESLTEQRSRWKKQLPHAEDLLDREGS
jgi:hypothetical protein